MVSKMRPAAARSSPRRSSSAPECASEAIGASELLSSWLITRITFFQVSTSWRRSSAVRREQEQLVRAAVEAEVAAREVVGLLLAVVLDREQPVAAAPERLAQRRRRALQQLREAHGLRACGRR